LENQEIKQKAAEVLAAVDRKIWEDEFSTVTGSTITCPTPESYVERFGIKEENYANLLDIIEELKSDPTIEVADLSDWAPCTLSYRGDEWIWTYDGDRDALMEEEENRVLPIMLSSIHNSGKLVTREIEYCEECGVELQINPYHDCDED
jgi:hypothetical protein